MVLSSIRNDHDGLARVLDEAFVRTVRDHLTDLGFDHVSLDLHDYRTGRRCTRVGRRNQPDADEPLVEDVFDTEYPTSGR